MIENLVNKYIESRGTTRKTGDAWDISPIAPYLLLDIQYQYYCDHIAKLPVKFWLKKVRNEWKNAYNSVNQPFFKPYTWEERDELRDLMDDLKEYLSHILFLTDIQFQNIAINHLDQERQKIYSICNICNIIAQCAQFFYEEVNRDAKGERISNRQIEAIRKKSIIFGYNYVGWSPKEGEVDSKYVTECINVLCKKIAEWMKMQSLTEKKLNELRTDKKRGPRVARGA